MVTSSNNNNSFPSTSMQILVKFSQKKVYNQLCSLQKQLNYEGKTSLKEAKTIRPTFFEPLPKMQQKKKNHQLSTYHDDYFRKGGVLRCITSAGNQSPSSTILHNKDVVPNTLVSLPIHSLSLYDDNSYDYLSKQFIQENDVPLPPLSSLQKENKRNNIRSNNIISTTTKSFPKITPWALSNICQHNKVNAKHNRINTSSVYSSRDYNTDDNIDKHRFRLQNNMQFQLLLKTSQKHNCKIFLPHNNCLSNRTTHHFNNTNKYSNTSSDDQNNKTALIRSILSSDNDYYDAYQKSFLLKHKFHYPALQIGNNSNITTTAPSSTIQDIIQRCKYKQEIDNILQSLYTGCTSTKIKKKKTSYMMYKSFLTNRPISPYVYQKRYYQTILLDSKAESSKTCDKQDKNHYSSNHLTITSNVVMEFFQKRCYDKYISNDASSIKEINHKDVVMIESFQEATSQKNDKNTSSNDNKLLCLSHFLLKNKRHSRCTNIDNCRDNYQHNDKKINRSPSNKISQSLDSTAVSYLLKPIRNLKVNSTNMTNNNIHYENPEQAAFLLLNDVNTLNRESIKVRSELLHLYNRAMKVEQETEVSASSVLIIAGEMQDKDNDNTYQIRSPLLNSDLNNCPRKLNEDCRASSKKQKVSEDKITIEAKSSREKKRKKHQKRDKNSDRKKRKKHKKDRNKDKNFAKKEKTIIKNEHQQGNEGLTQQQIQKKIKETTKFNQDGTTTKISMATITIVKQEKIKVDDHESNSNYGIQPKVVDYNLENEVQITPVVVDKKGSSGTFNYSKDPPYSLERRNNLAILDDEKITNSYQNDLTKSAIITAITPLHKSNQGTISDHNHQIPVDITPVTTVNPTSRIQQQKPLVQSTQSNNNYHYTHNLDNNNYLDCQPKEQNNNYLKISYPDNNVAQYHTQYSIQDSQSFPYYSHDTAAIHSSGNCNDKLSYTNAPNIQNNSTLQQQSYGIPTNDNLTSYSNKTEDICLRQQQSLQQKCSVIVLCSEKFFEEWPQVVTQLTTGRWSQSYFARKEQRNNYHEAFSKLRPPPQDNYHHQEPSSKVFSIAVYDCPLIDCSKVDIELPHQRSIILIRLSSWMTSNSTNSQEANNKKQLLKQMVQLASIGRYRHIHFLCVADNCNVFEADVLQDMATFQNALIGQHANGCPCQTDFQFCNLISLPCLLAERILLSAKIKSNKSDDWTWVEDIVQDTIAQERARFLISIAPSLSVFTIFHCFYQYSNEEDNDFYFRNLLHDASMDNVRFWNILFEGNDATDELFLKRSGKHLQCALNSLLSSNPNMIGYGRKI